jgi:threonylcarbamoyladenosine tRNA methylthiotransferase MtaB
MLRPYLSSPWSTESSLLCVLCVLGELRVKCFFGSTLRFYMPTFFIEQFGCRATQADGAALERQLLDRGCTSAPTPAAADIVVLNTCTVTASADAQARDTIRKLHAANPAVLIIATGCYAQRAPEELAALPGVSWVVGNSHKPQIPQLIEALSSESLVVEQLAAAVPHLVSTDLPTPAAPSSSPANFFPAAALHADSTVPFHSFVGAQHVGPHLGKILTGNIFDRTEFLSAPVLGGEGNHTRPTLKIQDGCDSRCSYCVIPFVRGKSRSLPPDTVIHEIQRLTVGQTFLSVPSQPSPAPCPAREIALSGINLGTYGRDLSPRVDFEDLVRRILNETAVERLRISSIEPLDVTRDLIDLFAGTDRIAQHFHMPLQSASDRILAAMHRWYRAEHYARRVELIHERLPHAAIGADVITGFPGESEHEHAATLAFIERLPFTYLHVFSFSKRPGTKAASLANEVPGAIIKRRARELRALGEAKSAAFRRSQLGRTLRVLTLRPGDDPDSRTTPALSSNYLKLSIRGEYPPNLWLDVQFAKDGSFRASADALETDRLSVADLS